MKKAKERRAEMGQIVHYVLPTSPQEERPAIITRIWPPFSHVGAVALVVFPAAPSDFPLTGILPRALNQTTIHDAAKNPRTWHWPDE